MEIINRQNGFKIEFNGSKTYMVTDANGDVYYSVNTLQKAKNKLKKVLELQNLPFVNF